MSTEEIIQMREENDRRFYANGYNAALLDVLERVIDKIDYQTRREILTMWKDGDIKPSVAAPFFVASTPAAAPTVVKVIIHDQVTV